METKNTTKKIIVVIACLLTQLCVGILYIWSIFNKDVQIYYNWDEKWANLVSSFMIFGFVFGNLIGGFLQDKTNPRLISTIGSVLFCLGILLTSFLTSRTIWLIYLTYSLMGGLGSGFVYGSGLSCLQKWFPTRRGFASGLSVAAFASSTIIFAPLSQFIISQLNVALAFRILGCTFLAITMLACLFIRLPENFAQKSSNIPSLTPKQTLKTVPFWCIALMLFFINATWNILVPIIRPLGELRGLNPTIAGIVVMITGITNATGRFSMASLSDKIPREFTIIINAVITFICAIGLIWAKSYVYMILVAFAAFAYGGPSATAPAMVSDLAGPKYSGTNYGFALLGLGFSSVVFNFLSNLLKEYSGGYTYSFILAASTCIISIILMLVYRIFKRKQKVTEN